jgi:tripeptidyl-peptidase-1
MLPQSFLTALRPDLDSGTTFAVDLIDGGLNPQGADSAGAEAVSLSVKFC